MEDRIVRIKEAILKWPYLGIFILVSVLFFSLNVYLNQSFEFIKNLSSFRLWFIIGFIFFSILVSILVALNVNLSIIRFKSLGNFGAKTGGIGLMGTFGGVLGGGCPACFAGFFPAFVGLFGITASLSIFPLKGLEIQMASATLLLISVMMLTKDPACKI
jgi:hypothetical protein